MDSQNNNASGETLRAKIQNGSLYEGDGLQAQIRMIDIATAAATELQRSHSKGIVYCDITPDSIFFDEDGKARIAQSELSRRFMAISEDTEEEEPPVKPWMDIHAWALTLLEMYLGEKRWTTGDDAKAHLKDYAVQCRLTPPPEMLSLIENCLKWKINDFLIVIKDLEKMPAAVIRAAEAAEAAEAAAAQQESEGIADGESGEQSADSDGDPSRPTASDTDPEYSSAEGTDSSQPDGQSSEGDNAREKQGLFSRIKGLFRSGK